MVANDAREEAGQGKTLSHVILIADGSKRRGCIGWGFKILGPEPIREGGGAISVKPWSASSTASEFAAVTAGLEAIRSEPLLCNASVLVVSDCETTVRFIHGTPPRLRKHLGEWDQRLAAAMHGRAVYASMLRPEYKPAHNWCHCRARAEVRKKRGERRLRSTPERSLACCRRSTFSG